MDAVQKAALEKRIVIGLVGLFVIAFVTGPMKSLGWFKPPAAAPAVEKVTISKPLGAVMEDFWKRVTPDVGGELGPRSEPAAPAAYTAHQLRDPFSSLLPQAAETPADQLAGLPSAVAPPPPPAKRPAPELHVEGLLWGGPTPSAILNGEVYRVGDEIQGDPILSIDRRGVTLEHEGDRVLYPPASTVSRESQ